MGTSDPQQRAAGVLYTENDDDYGYASAVICDTELVRELTLAVTQPSIDLYSAVASLT